MSRAVRIFSIVFAFFSFFSHHPPTAFADANPMSLVDAFKGGEVKGQLKTYYFAQDFDGEGLNDSQIWVNGGNLGYKMAQFYGFDLGATFQASFVGHKDDEDGRTKGSLDADGAVLSEAYLGYTLSNTQLIGGRLFLDFPLVCGSGSRIIKESFEAYLLSNSDIAKTTITGGLVTKYQTRTDKSKYADNWFVEFEENGTGDVGDFYDIGEDGLLFIYALTTYLPNISSQAQYVNVLNEVSGFYIDAAYTFDMDLKPYIAGQFSYTDYDDSAKENNELYGFKAGAKISGFDFFAAFTSSGGNTGEARVFRGVGQGAYAIFTSTTKSSGASAYEAETDSFQIGTAYSTDSLSAKLRFSIFENPAPNRDLDEYTFNFLYKFSGWAKNLQASIDFSILDYENDQRDATDLRTRLIYSF